MEHGLSETRENPETRKMWDVLEAAAGRAQGSQGGQLPGLSPVVHTSRPTRGSYTQSDFLIYEKHLEGIRKAAGSCGSGQFVLCSSKSAPLTAADGTLGSGDKELFSVYSVLLCCHYGYFLCH